jgi:hypothetical protein
MSEIRGVLELNYAGAFRDLFRVSAKETLIKFVTPAHADVQAPPSYLPPQVGEGDTGVRDCVKTYALMSS